MKNKAVFIIGSTDGIGKQTALELAKKNFFVIIHGRNEDRCLNTINEIKKLTDNINIDFVVADLEKKRKN